MMMRWVMFLSLLVVIVTVSWCEGRSMETSSSSSSSSMPARPTRPEHFTTVEEVKDYAEKLKEYYFIIGRGRFGKRSNEQLFPTLSKIFLLEQQLKNLQQRQQHRRTSYNYNHLYEYDADHY